MKILAYIGLAIGLTTLTLLMVWQGFGEVFGLLFSSGWSLLLLPLGWLPCHIPATASWRLLFAAERMPRFAQAAVALWMGRAVNTLLPVMSIGGEVVKARVLMHWNVRGSDASASVVVDKTVQVLAMVFWGVIGVGLLAVLAVDNGLMAHALIGFALLGAGIAGFLIVQRAGMFGFIVKSAGKVVKTDRWNGLADSANAVDAAILALYRRPRRVALSVGLRLAGLVWQTSEVWLSAYLLGHPIGLLEALMLKSLSATLSDVAFLIPNSYGVQEGAYVMLGALLGLTPEFMLAVSLATRIRELLVDVPGLIAWQHMEGKALLRRRGDLY